LDLSLSSTGFSKFSSDGKLLEKGKIVPEESLDNCFKIQFITNKIQGLYHNVDECVIEDIFLGKNFFGVKELARLSGAVIYSWVTAKYKIPKFYMASSARRLLGIKPASSKAELQVWVLKQYKFAKLDMITQYEDEIERIYKLKTKGKRKYQFDKLSDRIEKETEMGNDLCDSIILGNAYFADRRISE
jgi:Holliday junction resolvasome RuvABC endonuclease subunit